MIDRALVLLVRMRWRAMFRKSLRGAKSKRGIGMFIFGIALLALWIGPAVFLAMRGEKGDLNQFRALVPLGLLGMCMLSLMTSAGERAIYFSPGEIEFLFPGPFGRREVLAYKLLGTVMNVMIGSLFFSLMAMRYTTTWLAAYVGVVLSLVFVQYVTMAVLIVGESFSQRAYTRIRKGVVYAVGIALAAAAGRVVALRNDMRMGNFVQQLHDSPWLAYLLAPFEPFARVMTAKVLFPDMAVWAVVCVAMNAALFALIVLLDAEYRETAIRVSQRMYTRLQRAQRSGMAQSAATEGGRSVPHLPWLGGAGPIVWRQATNALRNGRTIVLMMVLLGVAIGVSAMHGQADHKNALALSIGLFAWVTILLTMMVRFDFRTDIEQMDWLKVLPLSSTALALGQMIVPVAVSTAMQTALACLAAYFMKSPQLAVAAFVFGLPTNFLLFGIENTLFLLMPSRTVAFGPGDFQVFGRQLLFMLVKGIVASIAWALALAAGFVVSYLAGGSHIAGGAVAWCVLIVWAAATVPCVSWAFRRYDVSIDTPV